MRHGQSQANADHIVAGHQDSPLSPLGKEQAERAGQALRHNVSLDLIVSSPMQRSRQTAEIIAQSLGYPTQDILVLPELGERHLGELEGKHYNDTPYGSGNVIGAEAITDIEPITAFYDRVKRMFDAITRQPGEQILVVCHNGVGRMMQVIAQHGQPLDMYKQPRLENGVMYPLKKAG